MGNLNRNKTKRNISLLFSKSNIHFTFNKEKLLHQIKTKNPFHYLKDSLMLSDHERSYTERFFPYHFPSQHTHTHIGSWAASPVTPGSSHPCPALCSSVSVTLGPQRQGAGEVPQGRVLFSMEKDVSLQTP